MKRHINTTKILNNFKQTHAYSKEPTNYKETK